VVCYESVIVYCICLVNFVVCALCCKLHFQYFDTVGWVSRRHMICID